MVSFSSFQSYDPVRRHMLRRPVLQWILFLPDAASNVSLPWNQVMQVWSGHPGSARRKHWCLQRAPGFQIPPAREVSGVVVRISGAPTWLGTLVE